MMEAMLVMSSELFLAIVFTIINLQIQARLIAFLWAKGCSWAQMLDIYDLRGQYSKWLTFDFILNTVIIYGATYLFGGPAAFSLLSWGTFIGVGTIEGVAIVSGFVRTISSKVAIQNNPNLLDFNGKYKNTCEEYKKLVQLLDGKKLQAYRNSASRLWSELLLLNQRRNEAYKNKKQLEVVMADVQKLINQYSIENDVEKRLKAQARLNQIIKQEADIDDFTQKVEEQIKRSETIFMDIRTNLAIGHMENILPDLTEYTTKVKALEYTVNQLEK